MAALTAPRTYAPAKIQLELPNQPCALAWVGDALVAATYDYVCLLYTSPSPRD